MWLITLPKIHLSPTVFENTLQCVCTLLVLLLHTGSESRLQQGFERFLATPPQSGGPTSFKFVTECFFITQRALHVGLLPAVNTFINLSSELNKSKEAKIQGRNEDVLKLLSVVSHRRGSV